MRNSFTVPFGLFFFFGVMANAFATEIADSGQPSVPELSKEAFEMVVDTKIPSHSAGNEFILPLDDNFSYAFVVDWGDGNVERIQDNKDVMHAYANPGAYSVKIEPERSFGFPAISFFNAGDKMKLTEIKKWGSNKWKSFSGAFWGCRNLKILAEDVPDTSAVKDFRSAFRQCVSMERFPEIDASSATTFAYAWSDCSSLCKFPDLNSSNVDDMIHAWENCKAIKGFPILNTNKVRRLDSAWEGCSSLLSFPTLNTSSVVSLRNAWKGCSGIQTFPEVNTSKVASFQGAWYGCGFKSFPKIDTSNGIDFSEAWANNPSLLKFPKINTSKAEILERTWMNCRGLEDFPELDTSKVTDFRGAWWGIKNLKEFPALDLSKGENFKDAFREAFKEGEAIKLPELDLGKMLEGTKIFSSANIHQKSYSDLLISLEANNQNHHVNFDGGISKYSDSAVAARQALIEKRGWKISDGGLSE